MSAPQGSSGGVLFVAYGGGHVASLAPVAAAMQARGEPFEFLALTTARPYLEQRGIPCFGFKDLPAARDLRVTAWGEELARALTASGVVSHEETVAYLGLNFRDLVSDVGEDEAWQRYRRDGRQAFLPLRTMRELLQARRPAVVVSTNSPRAERAVLEAAGELGIASVCAVDLFALQEVQWVGKPGYGTKVCVLNEAVRTMFLEHGRRPDEVVVTGNAAFDRLSAPEAVEAGARLRAERGWDDGRVTLLWASQAEPAQHPFTDRQGDPELPRVVERELRKFIADNAGYRLVVRYHPSEREHFVPQAGVELSTSSEDLGALLHAVDAVVVTASTVGLEASLAGRPVVSVDASVFTEDAPYSRMGISTGVRAPGELAEVLRNLAIAPPAARSDATAHRERATPKVLQVIESLNS